MDHEVYLQLAELKENQQYLVMAVAYLIEKKIVPKVEELEKWAKEKEKKEVK